MVFVHGDEFDWDPHPDPKSHQKTTNTSYREDDPNPQEKTHTHTPLKNLRIPIMINNYLNPNKSSDSGQFIISNLGNYKSLT